MGSEIAEKYNNQSINKYNPLHRKGNEIFHVIVQVRRERSLLKCNSVVMIISFFLRFRREYKRLFAAGWLKAIISGEHYAEKYFLSVFHLIFAVFLRFFI